MSTRELDGFESFVPREKALGLFAKVNNAHEDYEAAKRAYQEANAAADAVFDQAIAACPGLDREIRDGRNFVLDNRPLPYANLPGIFTECVAAALRAVCELPLAEPGKPLSTSHHGVPLSIFEEGDFGNRVVMTMGHCLNETTSYTRKFRISFDVGCDYLGPFSRLRGVVLGKKRAAALRQVIEELANQELVVVGGSYNGNAYWLESPCPAGFMAAMDAPHDPEASERFDAELKRALKRNGVASLTQVA